MKNWNLLGPERVPSYLLILLFCFILLARFYLIMSFPLFHPSEGRYAEISRNMVTESDWITPQIEVGVPFWGKPPLLFWFNAVSLYLFGVSKFSVRAPSFIICFMTAFLVYKLGVNLRNRIFGIYCALILSSTLLFFLMAGAVLTDPFLMFSITLSLISFYIAIQSKTNDLCQAWAYCFFAGIGLSVLSKGLIGLVLIIFPVFISLLFSSQWRKIANTFPHITGMLLTLLIVIPWHLLAEYKTPGFLNYYIIGEHLKRFMISGWRGDLYGSTHNHMRGMIVLFTLLDTLPWNIPLLAALFWLVKRRWKLSSVFADIRILYLLTWFITPIIFFCFANNIVFTYALPSLPPFAILTVLTFQKVLSKMGMESQPFRLRNSHEKATFFLSVRALIICVLFVPLVTLIASHLGKPFMKNHYEQEQIMAHVNHLIPNASNPKVFFIGNKGYTMSFYSHNQMKIVTKPTTEWLSTKMNDDNIDYYILDANENKLINGEFLNSTREVMAFDRYDLRKDLHDNVQKNNSQYRKYAKLNQKDVYNMIQK